MKLFTQAGVATTFVKDETNPQALVTLGADGLDRLVSSTELSKAGVRRIVIRADSAYPGSIAGSDAPILGNKKSVSVALTINVPSSAPFVGAEDPFGPSAALIRSLNRVLTVLLPTSVNTGGLDNVSAMGQSARASAGLADPVVRGVAGITPLAEDAEFGPPTD